MRNAWRDQAQVRKSLVHTEGKALRDVLEIRMIWKAMNLWMPSLKRQHRCPCIKRSLKQNWNSGCAKHSTTCKQQVTRCWKLHPHQSWGDTSLTIIEIKILLQFQIVWQKHLCREDFKEDLDASLQHPASHGSRAAFLNPVYKVQPVLGQWHHCQQNNLDISITKN